MFKAQRKEFLKLAMGTNHCPESMTAADCDDFEGARDGEGRCIECWEKHLGPVSKPEDIKKRREGFVKVAELLMEWMSNNCHPHTKAIIDSTHAELMEGYFIHVRRMPR